jgi:hypothetical protein
MPYKLKERELAYRLFVEEGVQVVEELARRSGLSKGTLAKLITAEARKDYQQRVRETKRLYVEQGLTDVEAICAQAKISPVLFRKIYAVSWDQERADYVTANPVLYTTGQILQQAAELLLTRVRTTGYSGEDVKTFINLANAFEQFRTGEHRIEMAMVGIGDFADWFRDNAKRLRVSAPEVRTLVHVLDEYRQQLLNRLREIA